MRMRARWRVLNIPRVARRASGALLVLMALPGLVAGQRVGPRDALPDVAALAAAPSVPPPLRRTGPARVAVLLEAREVTGDLADGVTYSFWTYGGTVPGQFIRVRVGDVVEFHLSNHPQSRAAHNIDLHAVTGPGGGAAASFVAPGQTAVFEFHAQKPGLYVYHCATAPVGLHVANGMYGLVLVEPRGGLPPADREYYVMQGEFYTDGVFGELGHRRFNMEKALAENPDYVLFNGRVGSLVGDRALKANVGETVRLFVGNGGPSLTAAFHVTGEIFDRVYPDGGGPPLSDQQTVTVPPGGAVILELVTEVPGAYALADHSLLRAFSKGALGQLRVEGADDGRVFTGRTAEDVYLVEGGAMLATMTASPERVVATTREERIEFGRLVYGHTCRACHQEDGRGVPGSFPPLAGSDFLNADSLRAVRIVLNGLEGPIVVNDRTYTAVMPALRLSDEEIANVLTYVYSQWGNSGATITTELVRRVRLCPWCEGPIPR